MAVPGVTPQELDRGLLGQIEVHSIDWIPDTERHGKTWQQSMLWFLGNFQYFTIPIGFVGPSLGLSLGWTILASSTWSATLNAMYVNSTANSATTTPR